MRPRIRTLKPEVWQDEKVCDLSHGARLLFIGLITMADDQGRLRELPVAINGHIFPNDNVSKAKLTRWLNEVEHSGMVIRYEVAGKRYIFFPHWEKHQRVDRPNDSELPEPPDFDDPSTNNRRSDKDSIDDQSRSLRAGASGPVPSPPGRKDQGETEAVEAREIFDYWREKCGHPDAKPTRDRIQKIIARRKEGYTVEQIHRGIDGAAVGAFVNERGKRFDDIELICRSGAKLESFIERAKTHRGSGNVIQGRFSEYDKAAGL